MKEDKQHNTSLEQRLREAAENFEMQPSEAVWENIAPMLPGEGGKKVIFLRWAAVAAVLLLLGGMGWYFLQSPTGIKKSNTRQPSLVTADSARRADEVLDQTTAINQGATIAKKKSKKEKLQTSSTSTISPKDDVQRHHKTADIKNHPKFIALHDGGKSAKPKSNWKELSKTNLSNGNSGLPILQNITASFADEKSINKTLSLHYSEKIAQLMLDAIRPAAVPLLAKKNTSEAMQKVTVGLFFTPGVSYRTLKTGSVSSGRQFADVSSAFLRPNTTQNTANPVRVNVQEKPLQQKQGWGWNSGLRVAWHFSEKWLLQTGLSLRHTSYEITAYKQDPVYVNNRGFSTMAAAPLANSTYASYVNRYAENNQMASLENRYLSTELPLLIGRRFGDPDKFSLTVLTGAGLTYLLHSNAVMYAPKSQRYFSDEDYLHPFNTSLILEANMNIPLSKNIRFSIGPAFQYQLFSTYKNYDSVKEFPYLIGIKTALALR